jgi:hypothetical protein
LKGRRGEWVQRDKSIGVCMGRERGREEMGRATVGDGKVNVARGRSKDSGKGEPAEGGVRMCLLVTIVPKGMFLEW